ncbi:aminotransferase class III-fold pyridoxal phosphate-dependent enzyme [Pseudomonas knackmussii]|uniref:aminotransferase class III-fold pyridoxal phosphate-dependent enzyme n=1 Tax=Pseudomonas knackmussii TaxID=65741 RepID=UPI003BD37ACE
MTALISSSSYPLPVVHHARGVFIYDNSGNGYIDGSGGAMTVSIGHGVPEVLAAMSRQAQQVCFTYRTQFTSAAAEELAAEIAALAPGDLNKVFFVNSGSEATELSMRVAIQYWQERGQPTKTKILGRSLSYHGMTMGSLSMSGHAARRGDYSNLLHQFAVAPPAYAYRYEVPDDGTFGASVWEAVIQEQGADNIAAVIVEPVVGAAGGALTPPIGYLKALREICDRHSILLISDEVITGMGRTGKWFGCEHDGIVPDIIATGKGMSSGYTPMGGVIIRDAVMDVLGERVKLFGHTFSANPLSAATCLAVIRYMKEHAILDNVAARSVQLESGLKDLSVRYPWMADVRGRGLLWGFEFVKDAATKEPIDTARQANLRFTQLCFGAGLIVYPAGIAPLNNSALLAPPLVISASETEELLSRLEIGLKRFGIEMGLLA